MTSWRDYQEERKNLYAEHLHGKDCDVQIERIEPGEVVGLNGKKTKRPMVRFRGIAKPFALNITNSKAIEKLAGTDRLEDWVGMWITLYPTTTTKDGETCACIRVRPKKPRTPGSGPLAVTRDGRLGEVRDVSLEELVAKINACTSVEALEACRKELPRRSALSADVAAGVEAALKSRREQLAAQVDEPGANG